MPRMLEDRPTHVIEVEGVLDVRAAERLRDTVLGLDAADRVVIDCHEVRELQDSALAFLAWNVLSPGRRVELRGIGEHHLRLLRYLDVGTTDAAERGIWTSGRRMPRNAMAGISPDRPRLHAPTAKQMRSPEGHLRAVRV